MQAVKEGIREWEVWTRPTAKRLNQLWGTPTNTTTHHAKFLATIASRVRGQSVLDVGCGSGHFFHHMRHRDYLGVDISEFMLEQARRYYPDDAHRFVKGDVYDLDTFAARDTVVANSVLIHLPEIAPAIHELWRKANRQLIFNMHIGNASRIIKRRGYGGKQGKYLISHTTTLANVFSVLADLRHLHTIQHTPYNHIVGDIFDLTRG